MLDIHTHLYWKSYDADRDEVVRRAREVGVKKIICVGTSPEDNPQALAVAEKYEDVYASVGIHPHFFNEQLADSSSRLGGIGMTKNWIEELKSLAKHPKVIAIGECGLDYFSRNMEKPITDEQKALQKAIFLAQIEIARELNLPTIIHCRDAYDDLFGILSNSKFKIPNSKFILHCYQGDTEITKKFLELPNVYFSFAGNITYPVRNVLVGTKDDLQETLKLVPLNRLFVETDSPFLAPDKKRGERNEPSYVRITAGKVRALKGVTEDDLEAALDENFQRVFVAVDKNIRA